MTKHIRAQVMPRYISINGSISRLSEIVNNRCRVIRFQKIESFDIVRIKFEAFPSRNKNQLVVEFTNVELEDADERRIIEKERARPRSISKSVTNWTGLLCYENYRIYLDLDWLRPSPHEAILQSLL